MAESVIDLSPSKVLLGLRILIVDNEDILASDIEAELNLLGAEVARSGSCKDALQLFKNFAPDVVITDLNLPDGNGLDLLTTWKKDHPEVPVILITAHSAVKSAVAAMRLGAFDYLQKPFDFKNLVAAVQRAGEVSSLRQKVSSFQGRERDLGDFTIIGEHKSTRDLIQKLQRIAKSKVDTVLITGPSGTGKELAARALHTWSTRSHQPFVEINCASIPENLLESELFGHEKGAFTDARERKLGLFEIAKGGTIFLDEIGEIPLKIQVKLLRVLEYKRFKRLGGTKDIELPARIVAATNRNLLSDMSHDQFRKDLYYRLNVINVKIPSLAERIEDIAPLTEHLVDQVAKELEISKPAISDTTYKFLASHSWPGNIRELKNVIKRALVLHEPDILRPQHLELEEICREKRDGNLAPSYPTIGGSDKKEAETISTNMILPESGVSLEDIEKSLLIQALDRSKNNQTKASILLGITRHTLRYRLDKYGLLL
jgi:DNA-binding NtrC family response regulator